MLRVRTASTSLIPAGSSAGSTANSYALSAAPGSLLITGRNAAISHIYALACAAGANSIRGFGASIALQRATSPGSLAVGGRPAARQLGYGSTGGALTVTGRSVSTAISRGASPGSLAVTGPSAARSISFAPPATAQRAITGRSTAIANGRFSSTGGFVLGGAAADLHSLRQVAAGSGSFALTGSSAGYSYSHTSGYVLGAGTGQYTISMFGDGNTKHRPFMKRKRVRFGLTP